MTEVELLKQEIAFLRAYGNKDCTAQADEARQTLWKAKYHGECPVSKTGVVDSLVRSPQEAPCGWHAYNREDISHWAWHNRHCEAARAEVDRLSLEATGAELRKIAGIDKTQS